MTETSTKVPTVTLSVPGTDLLITREVPVPTPLIDILRDMVSDLSQLKNTQLFVGGSPVAQSEVAKAIVTKDTSVSMAPKRAAAG